jgi:hypothetical protein
MSAHSERKLAPLLTSSRPNTLMFSLPRQPERGSDATQQGQNAIKAMFGANDVTVVNSATIGSQCSITLPKEDQHNRDDRQSDFCENWYGRGDFESIIILNAVGESVSRSFADPSMPNNRTVKYTDLGPSDIVVISGNLSKHPEDPQEQTFRAVDSFRGEAHLLEYEEGRSMIAVRRQDDASSQSYRPLTCLSTSRSFLGTVSPVAQSAPWVEGV